jgi:hypothetical protein
MSAFDPISALVGGGLIGLASALLMLFNGRIAGISGILGGALTMSVGDKIWRVSFIAGGSSHAQFYSDQWKITVWTQSRPVIGFFAGAPMYVSTPSRRS